MAVLVLETTGTQDWTWDRDGSAHRATRSADAYGAAAAEIDEA